MPAGAAPQPGVGAAAGRSPIRSVPSPLSLWGLGALSTPGAEAEGAPLPGSRRWLTVLSHVVLLLAVLAGAVAWTGADRSVSLRIDGAVHTVHTSGATVGAVLHSAGIVIGPHDQVVPDLSQPVRQGSAIVIRRGRPVRLSLDGQPAIEVWTTGRQVGTALHQLGLDAPHAYVSAPGTRPIGLDGTSLQVRLPQQVQVLADGHVHAVQTTAARVADLLAGLHVRLRPADRVSVPLASYPLAGLVVTITRVDGRTVRVDTAVPFPTVRRPDASLMQGVSEVATAGVDGVREQVFALTFLNHRLAGRRLVSSRLRVAPVAEVIDYGTASPPPPVPAPAPAAPVMSSGGLNWGALANCESGGNPRAVSPDGNYYGLYQFSLSTWQSVGGSGNPADASPSEQTYRAQILYQRDGRGAWPVCGQYL